LRATATEDFLAGLRRHLLSAGVAPRHVKRTVDELNEHLHDIRDEAGDLSEADALHRIGEARSIAAEIVARPELKIWIYRYPKIAKIYLPFAYFLLLPIAPLFAGAAHASIIVRWGASLFLAAVVTAATLLVMQLSITLT
jgi:hypothetical protein